MREKIKSVHITNYYHENSGGVKTNYDRLLRAAEQYQRYVRLIVPGEFDRIEDVNKFAKIYYVKAAKSPLFDSRYRLIMPWQYLITDSPVRNILREETPDMIEVYDNYLLTFLAGMIRTNNFKKLGRPMLVYFTGERLDTIIHSFLSKGRIGNWFSRKLMGNFNLPMFDFYIANSDFVAEELFESAEKEFNPNRVEWFYRWCWRLFKSSSRPLKDRIAICPRGVDIHFFTPARRSREKSEKIREEYGLPPNSVILLSSTRISPEKNIEMIPKIMDILKDDHGCDFRFLVAGDGPQAEWIKKEAEARFPGKLLLLGHLDKEKLADLYSNCDVFIHPNPREPFGNVALEAMASGAPVLVANRGGVLEYATDNNAWLGEPDAESFAKKVVEILSDGSLRASKTVEARKTAELNSQEAAIDRLFATYDRMFEDFKKNQADFVASHHIATSSTVAN